MSINNSNVTLPLLLFCTIVVTNCMIGILIGQSMVYNDYRREVCQALSVTAEDYINCNSLDWKSIIKQIPKRRK